MPALIDLRRRIKSVWNTQQITQAMKTVATAKLKKAQRTVLETRPYWHSAPDFAAAVAYWAKRGDHPLLMEREEMRIEVVVIASDKGLAGAFNSNLLAETLSFLEKKADRARVNLVLLGKKAVDFFNRHPFSIDRVYSDLVHEFGKEDLKELAQFLIRLYVFNKTDAVYVAYNEFKSILAPKITVNRLLPISPPRREESQEDLSPDWEPDSLSFINALFPLYIENQIHHFFFESQAAEHAARMMAMDNASKNAEELIEDLTLVLNKIRQASITKELLEIMTAVEALAKK